MKILGADWGTSNLRTYLIDENGGIISTNNSDNGLVVAKEKGFLTSLLDTAKEQIDECDLVILSGMVGAKEGWVEAKYANIPVSITELANALQQVPDDSINACIIPGLLKETENNLDVMRGEETQIFGCLEKGIGDGVYIAPGTHAKWCLVENNKIVDFHTFLTGDLYNALIKESILKLQIKEDDSFYEEAFQAGLNNGFAITQSGEILHAIFETRVKGVLGKMDNDKLGSYLSGLLIGMEVNHASSLFQHQQVVLIGTNHLANLYEKALKRKNIQVTIPASDIVVAGQFAIAKYKLK